MGASLSAVFKRTSRNITEVTKTAVLDLPWMVGYHRSDVNLTSETAVIWTDPVTWEQTPWSILGHQQYNNRKAVLPWSVPGWFWSVAQSPCPAYDQPRPSPGMWCVAGLCGLTPGSQSDDQGWRCRSDNLPNIKPVKVCCCSATQNCTFTKTNTSHWTR